MQQTKHTEESGASRIIYIHGFNSSPDSQKAQLFSDYCAQHYAHVSVYIPALSYDPQQAMAQLEQLIKEGGDVGKDEVMLLVGSSLGGYYATYLAEKFCLKAALINPAVAPCRHLNNEFIGPHTNYYTGEDYELTMKHVDFLATLELAELAYPENFLVLLQTGDEVLDYRLALDYYQGAMLQVQEGGDHGFKNFAGVLAEVFQFAELQALSQTPTISVKNKS